MKLAAYVIVRDEETSLPVTLESVKPFVDEIVICDTGSTDKTLDVARAYTNHVLIHPRSEEWRADRAAFDFSAARNHALEYLDNLDSDWIVQIDADEILDPATAPMLRTELEKTPAEINCILVTMVMCHDSGEEYQHFLAERLLRNHTGARFSNAMHNVCTVPLDQRIDWPAMRIIHNRVYKAAQSRYDRAHQRLEIAERYFPARIVENPKDARSMFYLAGTYYDCSKIEEAKHWFTKYLEVSDWPHERYQAAMLLTECYLKLGDLDKAANTMSRHLIDNWRRAEGLILLGDVAAARQDWPQAEWWYKAATLKEQPIDPLFVEVPAHTWEPHYKLYRVYQQLQNNQRAAQHGMEAIALHTPKANEIIYWVKNHIHYGDKKITCLVDRMQMNFLPPLADEWMRQGREVNVCSQAVDIPEDAEIVWCEWAGPECVKFTQAERKNDVRIVVRVHGYEVHAGLLGQVNWGHVDDVIFVASYLKDMAVAQCPTLPELCNIYVVAGGVETSKFTIGGAHGIGKFLRRNDPALDEESYALETRADKVLDWSRPHEYKWVLDRLEPGQVVVDVGAGYSKLADLMVAERACIVTRQDIDTAANEASVQRNQAIPATAELLPAAYDVVVCVSVLEHVEDIDTFVSELWETLRPGGRLLLTFDYPRVSIPDAIEALRRVGFVIDNVEESMPPDALAAHYILNTGWALFETVPALSIYAIDTTKPVEKTGKKLAMACYGNTKKEFPLALQVIAALPKEYSLHIATEWQDSRLEMYFRHIRKAMGLEGRVTLYPWQEDLNRFYADKDFYLSTSMEEAFQYSLAEGMAAGLTPVIHDWKSARDFYQPEWIWRTVDEARGLINRPCRVPQQMREYAVRHLDIRPNLRRIGRIINRPKVAVAGEPKFEYAAEGKILRAFASLGCRIDAPDGEQDFVLLMGRTPQIEPWQENAKKVLWIADMLFDDQGNLSEAEAPFRDARAAVLHQVDLVGVLSPNWVPILQAEGAENVEWMPIIGAARPFHYLPNVEQEFDLGFYGIMTERRAKIIEKLGKHFDVHVLDNCFDHEQVNLFINKCKVVLNLHAYGDQRLEWRLGECGAAGAVVVSEPLPDCGWKLPNVYEVPTSKLAKRISSVLQAREEPGAREAYAEWYWKHFRLDQAIERLLQRCEL